MATTAAEAIDVDDIIMDEEAPILLKSIRLLVEFFLGVNKTF